MTRTSMPKRGNLISRSALGVALALGVVAGGMAVATPAIAKKAPKVALSKGFTEAAIPAQKAIDEAKKRSDVVTAKANLDAAYQRQDPKTVEAAQAALAATLTSEKALIEQAFAAVENDDDRFMAGNLAVSFGSLADNNVMQRRGLEAMLASGKAAPEQVPQFTFFVGQIAYVQKDYANAIRSLQSAIDGGYRENNAEVLLAEALIASNQGAKGLSVLKHAIESASAGGQNVPEGWYRRGLGTAYNLKSLDSAVYFGSKMVKAYPNTDNWAGAITIVRELGSYGSQETLDLMRLMDLTSSYAEERDYIEYIQAADSRRLPGEVLGVIEKGLASGKLRLSDSYVTDARTQAQGRMATDKASLAGYTRDAKSPGTSVATITGAADALLSYKQPADAEALYALALGKPGVDAPRVLTRLGIAQVMQGKNAEAQQTLAKVTGERKPIAELWATYASMKAAPAAAPAAQ